MLLSLVNMKLRDGCGSLEELAEELDVSAEEIAERLAGIGYHYDAQANKFVP